MFRVENNILFLETPEKKITIGGYGHLGDEDKKLLHGALLLSSLMTAQHSQVNVMTQVDPYFQEVNASSFNSYLDLRRDLGLDSIT